MEFTSSSSSSNQQVLCGPDYVKVFKTNSNNSPEVAAGLHSRVATTDEQKDIASVDVRVGEEERPPHIIVVHGARKVGKSLLIKSLVEHYKENLDLLYMQGPSTIISGEQRRIQFVECPNSVDGMLDAAKYADAVILLIDANVGFEMETFEFVNILRVHGMPMVMGVLTSLDMFKNEEELSKTKEYLMNHFWTEIYEGARVFCLSGLDHGMYPKNEIRDLASFISDMEFHHLSWRGAQPYVLVDRFEDVTHPERIDLDNKCDRNIVLYGYLRGCDIKKGSKVHIAGVGDFSLFDVTSLVDPCPLLAAPLRKRTRKGNEHDDSDGFKPGTYLRLAARDVPFEMVQNYDPYYHPILVGGVSPGEENVGYMQATLKLHPWHSKLLSSRDPIIVSIGWRRYETSPMYAMEDRSKRLRMLHYTPGEKQCLARFWGPLASPNTGVVAVQSLPGKEAAFRILATGVVVDFNDSAKIMWKCKRPGTPYKISGKTALIKGLFKSDHAIDRFTDAKLWTESGIQGKVRKAAETRDRPKRKDGLLKQGIAKCKFKRKICMSDTIFMRVWHEIEAPPFFDPLATAPEPIDHGIKAYDELRREHKQGMPDLLDGPEEFPEGDLFKQETKKKKNAEGAPVWRRQTFEKRRNVIFVEREPSCKDRTFAKEFGKYPVLVISKEEEMLEKRQSSERSKKYLEKFLKRRMTGSCQKELDSSSQ